jgi:hypothetical protein
MFPSPYNLFQYSVLVSVWCCSRLEMCFEGVDVFSFSSGVSVYVSCWCYIIISYIILLLCSSFISIIYPPSPKPIFIPFICLLYFGGMGWYPDPSLTPHVLSEWMVEVCRFYKCVGISGSVMCLDWERVLLTWVILYLGVCVLGVWKVD